MDQIDRIAMNIGWKPTDWHRALCKTMPPMAVYGIFGDASYTPQRGMMTFPRSEQLDAANRYRRAVESVLGVKCFVSAES
jgi:hypothetical protein